MTPLELLQRQPELLTTQAKFQDLRTLMANHQLDGYLIPSADEHLNGYPPVAKRRRAWMSGFIGSAGDLLVGRSQAWLFVDSRYHEQADLQVDLALMQVVKLGLEEHPTLMSVLESLGQEQSGFRLGFDPFTIAMSQPLGTGIASFKKLQQQLNQAGVEGVPGANLVDQVRLQSPWMDADPIPGYADSVVFSLPDSVTGESSEQKLGRVRDAMQTLKTDVLPITKLDQIAWLFNLRGWDIPYLPVFIAYAIVTPTEALLLTNLDRVPMEVQQALPFVSFLPYESYSETLASKVQSARLRILVDPKHTTLGTHQLLTHVNARILEADNPIEGMKARKNPIELEHMRLANFKASRAKTRTFKWLADQLTATTILTEVDVARTVEQFYRAEVDFQSLSFGTIAGTGANSSIVHYGTPNAESQLQCGDLLLLDSGSHYLGGTTDDTRTTTLGNPTPKQIERYTAVLKAHINCAMQQFPKGTTGSQLDAITRSDLWQLRLDYGHGTGHGVGAFLNGHEGPIGLHRKSLEPLEPGMIVSIEPGYYEPGWGGIRIENLYVIKDLAAETGTWYGFESITYIPFDKDLIDLSQLNLQQQKWLEQYNRAIVEKLSPTLESDEVAWLQAVCQPRDTAKS